MEKNMFENLNSFAKTVRDGINLESMEFRPLKDFRGLTLKVDGFFFTEGKYGKQAVIVANGYKINMPKRAVEKFEQILNNKDMLDAVLEGHLALVDIAEKPTNNGTTTIYTFKTI